MIFRSLLHACPPLLALSVAAASASAGDSTAVYEVTFEATWSSTTHPGAFPSNAHFSPLIGGTHDQSVHFWQAGGTSSPGMENMAETGSKFPLSQEVLNAVAAGTAGQVIQDNAVPFPPAIASTTFTVTEDHPLVTLVTMIAPSPDWFVGVESLPLYENGQWRDNVVVSLFAYDAGTDSGANFNSPNQSTVPKAPISMITGGPFFGTTPLGTFTFSRRTSVLHYGCGGNPAGSLAVASGLPTLGQSVTLELDDPSGTMASPSFPFLAYAVTPDAAFPCGTLLPGYGLGAPGASGEFLIGAPVFFQAGGPWMGSAVPISVDIPNKPSLVSKSVYVQGLLIDTTNLRVGLTDAVELLVGP